MKADGREVWPLLLLPLPLSKDAAGFSSWNVHSHTDKTNAHTALRSLTRSDTGIVISAEQQYQTNDCLKALSSGTASDPWRRGKRRNGTSAHRSNGFARCLTLPRGGV